MEWKRSDEEALALLRGGRVAREQAISHLYRHYGRAFCRYFRRHGLSAEAAEDVMQDCFVKVLRSLETYRGEGSLEAWLWTIARNCLMSHLRAPAGATSLEDLAPDVLETHGGVFGGAPSQPAQVDCVRRGFERYVRVAPECAEAIMRVVADGWTYGDLASWRRSTQGATREYMSQCRKRLAEFVQPCFDALRQG